VRYLVTLLVARFV